MLIGTLHFEFIKFYVIHSPNYPIILGLPWLCTHNPHISWREGQILQWGTTCQERCLSKIPKASTTPSSSNIQNATNSDLPFEYSDLAEAFSKKKASQLPTHRSVDCAIELMPGTIPPKSRMFPLGNPTIFPLGFIRPSTSPASTGFFFVKKNDGGLRPYIDYHGLNDITVKFRYPLPLFPASLEQLRQAKFYTKLDLRNAYNLIRIQEGMNGKPHSLPLVGTLNTGLCPSALQTVHQSFSHLCTTSSVTCWTDG